MPCGLQGYSARHCPNDGLLIYWRLLSRDSREPAFVVPHAPGNRGVDRGPCPFENLLSLVNSVPPSAQDRPDTGAGLRAGVNILRPRAELDYLKLGAVVVEFPKCIKQIMERV